MKGNGMLVVSLRGVNFGLAWSVLSKMTLFLAVKVSFMVAREEMTKKKVILVRYTDSIHVNKFSITLISKLHTPNANMADHSVGAWNEVHGSEASQASVFCFDNAFLQNSYLAYSSIWRVSFRCAYELLCF